MNTNFRCAFFQIFRCSFFLVLIAAVVLSACRNEKNSSDPEEAQGTDLEYQNRSEPGWVFERKERKPIAVVFVHGIFGDALGTWTNSNGVRFFDLVKKSEGIGDKVDVFAFGYTSKMLTDGSLSIDGASNKLDHVLEDAGVWQYEQVVFVAHSMGGLVLMHEFTMNPERSRNVPLLIFYATPQEGSQITEIAKHIVSNDAIRQMLPINRNAFSIDLNNRWTNLRNTGQAPIVVCGYETKKTKGVMIVSFPSSSKFCDQVASPIEDTDHLTIVKPGEDSDMAALIFRNAVKKYVLPTIDPESWRISAIDTTEKDWTFDLKDVNDFNSFEVTNQSDVRQWLRIESADDNLYISTEYARRRIAARDTDSVKMFVIRDLKPDYKFKIQLGSTAERLVTVRIPNFRDALAMRAKRESERAESIAISIEQLRVNGKFDGLSPREQEVAVSNIAYEVASKQLSSAPDEVRWIVAASTLSKFNPAATEYALGQVKVDPQNINSTIIFQSIASQIRAETAQFQRDPNFDRTPFLEDGLLPVQLTVASQADVERWRLLTDVMAKVPAMTEQSDKLRIRVDRANPMPIWKPIYIDDVEGAVANDGTVRRPKGV